jgi:hypothetical protein
MAKKTNKKTQFNHFYDDPDGYESGYHDKLMQHRKDKRIRNALRSNDVRSLIDIDEEEYYN